MQYPACNTIPLHEYSSWLVGHIKSVVSLPLPFYMLMAETKDRLFMNPHWSFVWFPEVPSASQVGFLGKPNKSDMIPKGHFYFRWHKFQQIPHQVPRGPFNPHNTNNRSYLIPCTAMYILWFVSVFISESWEILNISPLSHQACEFYTNSAFIVAPSAFPCFSQLQFCSYLTARHHILLQFIIYYSQSAKHLLENYLGLFPDPLL